MKKDNRMWNKFPYPLQPILTMKLTVFLFFVLIISTQASSYPQKVKVSFDLRNVRVSQVLEEIEGITEYKFLYNHEKINAYRIVSFKVQDEPLDKALERLFKGTDVYYVIRNKQIILKNGGETKAVAQNVVDTPIKVKKMEKVTGTVLDENGDPLPYANVMLKGTNIGVVTDLDGKFEFETPESSGILVVSFIGYNTKEVNIEGKTSIEVSLTPASESLDEVVVVGYGAVKKSDLTGSVTSVTSEELTAYPALGATQAIQGRASGVMVTSKNGEPGSGARIRIRGGTSINASSSPLYVVDGFAGGVMPPPEDIASIEILKDASATAIYGSRGANGVVLITTKSGRAGTSQVNFNMSYSAQEVGKKLDLLNGQQFAEYINELYANDGVNSVPYPNPEQHGIGTDWQDEIFRSGGLQNYQVSANGGKENLKYYTSVNYYGNKGVVINSKYERFSGLSNLDMELSDKVRSGVKMYFMRTQNDGVKTQETSGGATNVGVLSAALKFEPVQGVYDENGNYTIHQVGDPHDNPVAVANEFQNNTISDIFQGNTFLEIDILKDLTFKSTFGVQIYNTRNGQFTPTTLRAGRNTGGTGAISSNKNTILLNENYLNYTKSFNDRHRLNFMAGYSYQSFRGESWRSVNTNFITNSFSYWNLGGGSVYQSPSSGLTEWTLASFYGRANYAFNDKYMLTFTGRYDGSSRFGANNKWAFFPSGAIAWNVKKESFMEDVNAISHFKLRASHGITGNTEIGSYQSLARLSPSFTVVNGSPVNAVIPSAVANNNLSWESTAQSDIGLDFGMFQDRVILTADYYYKKTSDLLYNIPLPQYSGYSTSLQNIGSVENKGWEFSLSTVNVERALSWNTNFNISFNRNKILELAGGDVFYSTVPGHMISTDSQVLREGEVVGAFYGWIFDGIYQENDDFEAEPGKQAGDVKYVDLTGRDANGNLDGVPNGRVNNDDRVIIGNPHPDFIFGFNNNFNYENFDLNIFFQGSVGNDMLNYTRMELDWMAGKSNATTDALNRWTPTNTDTNVPRASGANKPEVSTRWVEDGSYVRMKNLALGYSLPAIMLERWKLSKLRVYFSAQNLLTFTNYSGYDPEVSFRDSNTNVGLDYGSYPNVKSYTLGINVGL